MEIQSSKPSRSQEKYPRRRWKIRWLRCLAALVVLTMITEIVLRVVFGLGSPLLYQTDPDCGYVPKPNQNIERFFSRNFINKYSMRSPELPTSRPANGFRLFCIGDSVTYGTTYVSQEKIFTSRLSTALPDILHHPVEVLNISAGGWGPGNEWGYLKSRGTFDANLILFVWNTPDIGQPFNAFQPSLAMPTQAPYTAIGETWSRYVWPRLHPGAAPPPDPGSTTSTGSSEAQVAINLAMLTQARDFAAKAGAGFGVVYVWTPADEWQTPVYEGDHKALVKWTADQQIPLLDLTDAFHAAGGKAMTFDGIHLRPEGHELITREIISHWKTLLPEAKQ